MKKNKLLQFDLDLYSETLDNGLRINIVPKKNSNNIYVTFSTNYGSIHDEFIPIDSNEYYKVPMGVAHFLEHKVFEQKDGRDPFEIFSESGADSNANTSNYKTTYLFSGPSNFEKNINFLLDFVQTPYFTDENVEKEKGIISQEIKMLNDRPYWHLYERIVHNCFKKHPIKYPVGGTIQTIKKITCDDLYKCYNTFYHPSNMFITITGNVDPNKCIKIIKDNQSKKKFRKFKDIEIKHVEEPDMVVLDYEESNFDVSLPKVAHAYKLNIKDYDINRLRLYLNLYFSILTDTTSLLDEELKDNHIISSDLEFEVVNTDKHLLYIINFESNKYDKVLRRLDEIIGKKLITEEELNRKKKSIKSSFIYRSDNIYAINSKINNDIIRYNKVILDDFSIIESLNIEEFNNIIKNIDFSNISTLVLKNKEN